MIVRESGPWCPTGG